MTIKVLAVASGGGHWKQLMLIKEAFQDRKVKYVTTILGLPEQENINDYKIIKDSNKSDKFAVIYSFFQMFFIIIKYRPDVIISTGAAPGVLAILLGRIFFVKTIWLDSIANAENLSLGGRISRRIANTVLTQWEHLADGKKVFYRGAVF